MARRPDPGTTWGAGWSTGFGISATILGGIAAWGGIGVLVDWLAHTGKVFTAIGMVVGAVGAIYLVWLKHGRDR
jgi:hypothetical protein